MTHLMCTTLAALLGGPCYCADITMFLSPFDPIWPRHLAPPSIGVCRAHSPAAWQLNTSLWAQVRYRVYNTRKNASTYTCSTATSWPSRCFTHLERPKGQGGLRPHWKDKRLPVSVVIIWHMMTCRAWSTHCHVFCRKGFLWSTALSCRLYE